MTINVSVRDKCVTAAGNPVIVCGNSDCTVAFDFDEEWEVYNEKTARFTWFRDGAPGWEDVPFTGSTVSAPAMRETDAVAVGVYAGDIHTTTPAWVPCARCITDGAAVCAPHVTDIYNQLMEMLAELQGGQPGGKTNLRTWGSARASGMTWTDASRYQWRDAG